MRIIRTANVCASVKVKPKNSSSFKPARAGAHTPERLEQLLGFLFFDGWVMPHG